MRNSPDVRWSTTPLIYTTGYDDDPQTLSGAGLCSRRIGVSEQRTSAEDDEDHRHQPISIWSHSVPHERLFLDANRCSVVVRKCAQNSPENRQPQLNRKNDESSLMKMNE